MKFMYFCFNFDIVLNSILKKIHFFNCAVTANVLDFAVAALLV